MTNKTPPSHSVKATLRRFPFIRDAVVALITSAAVVLGQQIARGPNQLAAEAGYIVALQTRVGDLEERLARYSAQNTQQQIEIAALRATIDTDLEFQDLLCSILEAQPGVNWAKVVDAGENGQPEFHMACLDAEYRATFGIQAFQYIGQTDFEIWDEETAQQFYNNDLQVLTTRAPLNTYETWEHRGTGQLVQGRLTKFYFTFGGLEFIIGHFPGEQVPLQAPTPRGG